VPRANHQRFVCAVAFSNEAGPVRVKKTRQAGAFLAAEVSSPAQIQQSRAKKAGARPAFSQSWELR
jgi:hypothetical protein